MAPVHLLGSRRGPPRPPGFPGGGGGGAVPVNTVAPTISGTAQVGATLSGTDGTWTNSPTSYEYRWQRADDGAGLNTIDIGGTTSVRVSELADQGDWIRRSVRGVNGAGPGAWAYSAWSGPVAAAPTSSDIVALSNEAVRVALIPQTTAIPAWQRGAWTIERSVDGGATYAFAEHVADPIPYWIDTNPVPGVTNTYRCKQAGDPVAFTASVAVPAAAPVPAPVTGVTVSSITPTACVLTWTNPADARDQWFRVECNDGTGTWRQLCKPFRSTNRLNNVPGLLGGVANQRIRVIACSTGGESAPAESALFTTPAYSGPVPAAATNLTAVAGESTRISIEFRIPDLLPKGAIIETSSDGGATWVQRTIYGALTWRGWVTGLTASTTYQVRVRLFGDGGYAAPSNIATVTTLAAGVVLSPTGRTPRLGWTPHIHQRWMAWQANYAANPSNPSTIGGKIWKSWIETEALSSGSGTYQFYQGALVGATLYQATGNTAYIAKALGALDDLIPGFGTRDPSTDEIRSYGMPNLYAIEWMWPGMNAGQRTAATREARLLQYALGRSPESGLIPYRANGTPWGVGFGDSDQVITFYGLAMMAATAAVPWDAGSRYLMDSAVTDPVRQTISGQVPRVGGLSWDDQIWSPALSNQILGYYPRASDGGDWFESTQYNDFSSFLFAQSLEMGRIARSYDGDDSDYWVGYNTLHRPRAGRSFIDQHTPRQNQRWTWGDDDDATFINTQAEAFTFAMERLGFSSGVNGSAQLAASWIPEYGSLIGWNGNYTTNFFGYTNAIRAIIPIDFEATPTVARSTLPLWSSSNGSGRTTHVTAWDQEATGFWSKASRFTNVDHEFWQAHDFQLFRKSERIITKPAVYAGAPMGAGQCANSITFAGNGALVGMGDLPNTDSTHVYGVRAVVRRDQSAARTYVQNEAWGAMSTAWWAKWASGNTTSWMPTPYVHEHTRELVYLPSADATSDVVVVFDRAWASNPKLMPNYSGYANGNWYVQPSWLINTQALMDSTVLTKALVETHWQCPVSPTLNANDTAWSTGNGQLVKIEHLFPLTRQRYVRNLADSAEQLNQTAGLLSELRFAFSLYPTDPWPADALPRWYTFLNVASVRDSGNSVTSTLIQSSAGAAVQGALVTRTGQNDVVCLFNATPASGIGLGVTRNRDLTAGFTVGYTQTTANAVVYAHALSPSQSWTVSINGGAATPIAVNAAGCATFNVTGAGAKILVFA